MKKMGRIAALAAFVIGASVLIGCQPSGPAAAEKVTLTFGSWRTDDTDKINKIIAEFNKTNPNIEIKFDPTNPPDYNATLRLALENGTGPDIFYARSYDTGRELFKAGFMLDLSDFTALSNYDDGAKAPWTSADGKNFAQPFMAVSHGIYYNKDLFAKLGIAIPTTWAELLDAAKKIKADGVFPFANGLKDEWDINEVVWQNIAPGVIGGAEGRKAYESGAKPFNDEGIVAVFQALKDLSPYFPDGVSGVDYNSAKSLFRLGKAAMIFDGSWSIPDYQGDNAPAFDWSVFAVPAAAGKTGGVAFHPDNGIAINPKSAHIDAAKTFLTWLTTPEAGAAAGNNLVGFFPMIKSAVTLSDPKADAFLALNQGRNLDVRFTWPVLMAGQPSAYDLITTGSIAVITGKKSPKEAADDLAAGLAKWYEP